MKLCILRRMATGALTLTLGGVAVSAAGCASEPMPPRVEGRLASGGGYLGDWDLYPNRCTKTGDSIVLDRTDDARRKVRLFDRSAGTSNRLSKVELRMDDQTPSGPVEIVLEDATCMTGTFAAQGKERVGELKVDCTTGEGGHVVGNLAFFNCP